MLASSRTDLVPCPRRLRPLAFALVLLATTAWARPGDLDPSFGTGGIVIDTAVSATAMAVVLQAGRIVAGGTFGNVNRYDLSGALDPSFGVGGRVHTGFDVNAMVVQPDGKLVVGGKPSAGSGSRVAHTPVFHASDRFSRGVRCEEGGST